MFVFVSTVFKRNLEIYKRDCSHNGENNHWEVFNLIIDKMKVIVII